MAVNKVDINGATVLDLTGDSVTPETLLQGATAHDASGAPITGTLDVPASVAQATPSISVSSSGLITASATQSAGIVATGTKSATKQLTTQGAKTVTPSTSNQTAVASGRYTTGAVTVKGDANLKAENIKKDVSIFGVTGTLDSGGSGESRETWVFNESVSLPIISTDVEGPVNMSFISNGVTYSQMKVISEIDNCCLYYGDTEVAAGNKYDSLYFADPAFRKVVWLFSDPDSSYHDYLLNNVFLYDAYYGIPNAVKQPSDVAVQTNKALTITSNGTTNITPNVPYDAMSKVAVTVNVPGIVWVDPD